MVPPPCTDQGTNPYHGFGMPFTYRGVKTRAPIIRGCPYIESIQQELKIANGYKRIFFVPAVS